MKRTASFVLALSTVLAGAGSDPACAVESDGPYQATGFKVGEVTDTTAVVWTRLTRNARRNPADGPMVKILYAEDASGKRRNEVVGVEYPRGMTVADIRHAVPGTTGQVRVAYRKASADQWRTTPWQDVDPQRDFTRQILLDHLQPHCQYSLRVECRQGPEGPPGQTLEGRFRTAPAATQAARVVFTVSTGQGYGSQDRPDGYNIYPEMLKLDPSFFVHTGDIVYYDRLAKTIELARYHWQRTYSLPTNVEFHRQVASYFIKDDHDTWQNDCWPTMRRDNMFQFTFQQGLAVFREQVPMGPRTYRTYRWGKDLQIWLVEGRDFRSPNTDPDGPNKTIWGAEQKAWFMRTVQQSDATFRILISPTPMVGPDRASKADNHANKAFAWEGLQLRRFIGSQKNMFVLCGDRHWQYVSVDPETGVWEFSCGPVSNKHAGGWKQSNFVAEYHRYLNVIGGFLSVTIDRIEGVPTAIFRHHDVRGQVRHEERIAAARR